MSFLLKTLEKIVDRYIRDGPLRDHPLHLHQHAYLKGRSVETALHNLVCRIENVLEHGLYGLGAFLDIEGAFNNTSFEQICLAAGRHGVHTHIVRWIRYMLEQRTVTASLGGSSLTVTVTRGCPQGGVLSPLLWNMVVDGLLSKLNKTGVFTQGYADDIVILVSGRFLDTVCGLLQKTLDRTSHWCFETGLSVNPEKTNLVLFTKKRKREGFSFPSLLGKRLELSLSVKYLGVILDSKLNWGEHMDKKLKKACASLWTCRRALGKSWGLQPRAISWIYNAVVKPSFLHCSIVWWKKTKQISVRNKLNHLQRMACMGITGAMRTTPTLAMETLLNLAPLYVEVEVHARATLYRLRNLNMWHDRGNLSGHRQLWTSLRESDIIFEMRSDSMMATFNSSPPLFKTHFPSRECWAKEEGKILHSGAQVWFTDGSMKEGKTGAGVYSQSPPRSICIPLGRHATVFQAEIFAILTCVYAIEETGLCKRPIHICTDSQAALKALNSPWCKSKLLDECYKALNTLSSRCKIELFWVPGHSGISGNEMADELAKAGAEQNPIGPEPMVPVPPSLGVAAIRAWGSNQHSRIWRETSGLRQAKTLMGEPSPKLKRRLLLMNRSQLRTVVGLLTGHYQVMRHMHLLGVTDSDRCRRCEMEEETTIHLICECPAIMRTRYRHLG